MQPKMLHTGERPVEPLILNVFPGSLAVASGPQSRLEAFSTRIYDDAGNSLGYKTNEYAWTEVRQTRITSGVEIEIMPVTSSYPGMPTERGYEIRLPVSWPPESATFNGQKVPFSRDGAVPGWRYDGDHLTSIISLPKQPVTRKVDVVVTFSPASAARKELLEGAAGKIARVKRAMVMAEMAWPNGWAPDVMLDAAQTGNRISLHPEAAAQELQRLEHNLPEITTQLEALAQELLKMPDNGEGFGFTPREQLAAIRKAIAHIAAR